MEVAEAHIPSSSAPITQATREDQTPPWLAVDLIPWHQINSKYQETLNKHGNYWWQRSGYALAILLGKAGYSYAAQIWILDFFARSIAPRLGIANEPGVHRWKSFMTDDHNPIELSWDWNTGHSPPTVRFSLEPVGQAAGSAQDPYNEQAPAEFLKEVSENLPLEKMQWFRHFESYFAVGSQYHPPLGHQSRIFWAFDLVEKDVTGKAYFFPAYRAVATQKTTLQVISEAIESAPCCTPENLQALYMFQDYAHEQVKFPLEMDMLAIDMVEPSQSRLKIYFRARETSFLSVCKALTLGGRLKNKDIDAGIRRLRHLWDNLFDQQGVPDESPLPALNHRTAGILYYVDIRLGKKTPKVKVYLPPRHYAQNDWQIMNAVCDFMHSATADRHGATHPDKGQPPLAYYEAMCNIFGPDTLQRQRGRQTYVACSIEQGGDLRVVSYINPKTQRTFEDWQNHVADRF